MPFVERDEGGEIIAVYARPQPGGAPEQAAEDDPIVVAFRNRGANQEQELTARDLADALIAKGAIVEADLPPGKRRA